MGLLGKGTLDFILFLGILLIVTPVFCSEYSCQMDTLILTSKEGRKSALYKLLIMIAVVLFLSLCISLIDCRMGIIRFRAFVTLQTAARVCRCLRDMYL